MRTLKFTLEKPLFILMLILIGYGVFYSSVMSTAPFTEKEQEVYSVLNGFAQGGFPPTIATIRSMQDWGHLGYYVLTGLLASKLSGTFSVDPLRLRLINLVLIGLTFLVFVSLGRFFTYKNRLSPLWVSLALLLYALNPYTWDAAFHLGYMAMFLLFLLSSLYLYEVGVLRWSSVALSVAVLVDWRALLLAGAILISKLREDRGKILRPERALGFVLPFLSAALPVWAWHDVVPEGQAREWWHLLKQQHSMFAPDGAFYMLALLPLYSLVYSWNWGLRSRMRALTIGGVVTAVLVPLYFIFPIHFETWNVLKNSLEVPLGLLDQVAVIVAGPYKNLFLFLPWLAGTFLFTQLVLMDILEQSRVLQYFIFLFFLSQAFVLGYGDQAFLIVLPFVFLLSLSEAVIGEEGKLS